MFTRDPNPHPRPLTAPAPATSTRESPPATFRHTPLGCAYIRRGYLTEGFLRCDLGGLIFGGACTWRGLFSESSETSTSLRT